MFIGPNGAEHEKLINDIYHLQRRIYSCEYDGKTIKAWFLKQRLKRLKKKENKLFYADHRKSKKKGK